MAAPTAQGPNMEIFDAYFRRADLDKDGRISGAEAVGFFQGSNLPKPTLAKIWMYCDPKGTGFLGRTDFYNALKLVTVAQSGRELTPEIVKAALEGPAAAKIPAPQMNSVASPVPSINPMSTSRPQLNSMMLPSSHMGTMASQNLGFRGPQVLPNSGLNHQLFPSSDNQSMRPPQAMPAASSPQMQGPLQGLSGGGSVAVPSPVNSNFPNLSTDWLGGRVGVTPSVSQDGFGLTQSGLPTSVTPKLSVSSTHTQYVPPKSLDSLMSSSQPANMDSKPLVVSGNGFSLDSGFGSNIFSAIPQPSQDTSRPTFSAINMPHTSGVVSVSTGSQFSFQPVQVNPSQSTSTMPSVTSQLQQPQSLVKQNHIDTSRSSSTLTAIGFSVGAAGSASSSTSTSTQSQMPWPKITQSDIQKYTSVFVEVDKDRDGKITGEQARQLFLSWRLPRDVLKQVWDLSDQDNDSMLSLREFCIALFLMERFREGRSLPAVLPNSIRSDGTLLQATSQPSAAYGGPAWQPKPGLSREGTTGVHPVMPDFRMKSQPHVWFPPQTDGPVQPVQPKSSVPTLEKHLVTQISNKEQGALNSKFEEATVADKEMQELEKEIMDSKEKIEFYRTKMQDLVLYKSRCDNKLNEITELASVDKREVESLAQKYEEKSKQVGDVASKLTIEEATFRDIRARKMELFGAIAKMEQGGSADGLLQVRADRIQSDLEELMKALSERCKRFGLDVKPTAIIELPLGWQPGIQEGAADWDEDWDKFEDEGFSTVKELTVDVENVTTPPKPKASFIQNDTTSIVEASHVTSSSDIDKKTEKTFSTSERVLESESAYAPSEDGSARSPPSSPPGRSTLESPSQEFHSTQFGFNGASPSVKENQSDHDGAESTISRDKYGDEHSWGTTFDANDDIDSVWGFSTVDNKESGHVKNKQKSSFGSGNFGLNPIRTESPSAASVFGKEKSSFFADSVPGTPLFNSSASPTFNEGPDDHSFDSFRRFDSFSTHDSGFFPQRENLARFDSIHSTRDSDHSRGFPSFDDSDPFGSTGPFKSSDSHTTRRGSDKWSAF